MRKIYLLSLLCLAATACEKVNPSLEPEASAEAVTFSSSIKSTRASGSWFENGDKISVSAYSGTEVAASNVEYTYNSESIFSSAEPIKYTKEDLSFKAVYPYVDSFGDQFSFSVNADQSTHESYTKSDMMLASVEATSEQTPNLVFTHSLSRIVVNFKESDESLEGAKLSISALGEVDCDLTAETIVAKGDAYEITACEIEEGQYKVVIAPQTLAASSNIFTISVGENDYSWGLAVDSDIKVGVNYTCNLQLKDGEVSVWDSEGGEEIPSFEMLSDFSAESYPEDTDSWVINDTEADRDAYAGLIAAIQALEGSDRMISIEFPNLVKVTSSAFNIGFDELLPNIESLSFPVAATIWSNAFDGCSDLESFSAPKLEDIGFGVFKNCAALSTITMATEAKITKFGVYGADVFTGSNALSNIDLVIGDQNVFDLEKGTITMPQNDAEFTYGPFKSINGVAPVVALYDKLSDFSASQYPVDVDEWVINDETATSEDFDGLKAAIESLIASSRSITISLPNMLEIPENAFSGREKDLTVLSCVEAPLATVVKDSAFDMNQGISSLILPEVLTVEASAFIYMRGIESLTLPKATSIGDFSMNSTSLVEVNLPEVTTVGWKAFSESKALETVTMPKVSTFNSTAQFNLCESLKSVDFPLVVDLPSTMFNGCKSLESITLDAVETIGSYAFDRCTSLKSLNLAANSTLTSVGSSSSWSSLFEEVKLEEVDLVVGESNLSMVDLESGMFNAPCEDGPKVYGPFKSINGVAAPEKSFDVLAHFSSSSYPSESNEWTITNATATADDFDGLRDAITAISESGSDRLITITFSDLKIVPARAFLAGWDQDMTALSSVALPSAIELGENVFENCAGLSVIKTPKVKTVGNAAYKGSGIKKIALPRAITVGTEAFVNCKALTSVAVGVNSTLETFGDANVDVFSPKRIAKISLKLGASCAGMVDGTTFNAPIADGASAAYVGFKSIEVTE